MPIKAIINNEELLLILLTKLPKTAGMLLKPDKKFEVLFNVLVKKPPTPVLSNQLILLLLYL